MQESQPHELQAQDHLELGIDIVLETQEAVVHRKVAGYVKHAGFVTPKPLVDLDLRDSARSLPDGDVPSPRPPPEQLANENVFSFSAARYDDLTSQGFLSSAPAAKRSTSQERHMVIEDGHFLRSLESRFGPARPQSSDDYLGADVYDGRADIEELTPKSMGEEEMKDLQQAKGKEREDELKRERARQEQAKLYKDSEELARVRRIEKERRRVEQAEDEAEYQEAKAELERVIKAEKEAKRDMASVKAALAGLEHIDAGMKKEEEERIRREVELMSLEEEEEEEAKEDRIRKEKETEEVIVAYESEQAELAERIGKEIVVAEVAENKKRRMQYWICCRCRHWNSFRVVQCINVDCQHAYNGRYCNCSVETVIKKTDEHDTPRCH
ncbi:hypothetical protein C8A03DRAFT_35818 [Achaetomium macrosporum]|uniref:Uncharacterized protein n=1 Tax=Achaetomium macrosporum TaxID=79813 RepID=A0AAN7HD12_9PEZI|nr:hypothetical protein C8A03DRAFT_35818 [Achaetomium macrosporum]